MKFQFQLKYALKNARILEQALLTKKVISKKLYLQEFPQEQKERIGSNRLIQKKKNSHPVASNQKSCKKKETEIITTPIFHPSPSVKLIPSQI